MPAPTNILYMPVAAMVISQSNNGDWLDGLEYQDLLGNPIDLTGIDFAMEMRTSPPVVTIVLRATTANGLIKVYSNTWQFQIPASMMVQLLPADYVFDMLGMADGYTRNLVQAQVSIVQGITRSVIPLGPAPATTGEQVRPFQTATIGGDGMPASGVAGANT